jgi:hypothetical protein
MKLLGILAIATVMHEMFFWAMLLTSRNDRASNPVGYWSRGFLFDRSRSLTNRLFLLAAELASFWIIVIIIYLLFFKGELQ